MTQLATRVVFFGTPEFAAISLEALIAAPEFTLCGVVTQPDRPAGRGQQTVRSTVKLSAESHGIPVFQPETLRDPFAIETIRAWSPDVIVVAAFGQILRPPVLELPRYGCINVHASLLPRWRGAAPIQYAIRAGDATTGVTIMRMDAGLDTGPILSQKVIPIEPDETASTLHDKLAALAAEFLPDVLLRHVNHEVEPQPQPEAGVTLAPTLKKSDGEIDWSQPAAMIDRHVRAYTPWPGTFSYLKGKTIRVIKGRPLPDARGSQPPGALLMHGPELAAQTGQGLYLLEEIQLAGRRKMSGAAFARGRQDVPGAILSNSA
jgi:methionyl-tRNA formyltransferase